MGQKKEPLGSFFLLAGAFYLASLLSLSVHWLLILSGRDERLANVAWAVFMVTATAGLAISFFFLLIYLHKLHAAGLSISEELIRLQTGQKQNEAVLTHISENLLLCDAIKSVAFREKDRAVLLDAIKQDIGKKQWESATILINELEQRFGCREEAIKLREQIQQERYSVIQKKIDSVLEHVESLWLIHNYADAEKEIAKLIQLYPDNELALKMQGQSQQRRDEHKKELFARWDEAVKNNDIDQGVDILNLLDSYLSPEEAAAMEESARNVFRAKLHNMGVQFSLFVTGKKWNQALKVGLEIIAEYPNSRMAQEVQEKLKILEEKAK